MITEESKISVQLTGQDGNIFNLIGIASKAMKNAGQKDEAKEMANAVMNTGSYDEALQKIMEFVNVE